jgi:hypothetical protein
MNRSRFTVTLGCMALLMTAASMPVRADDHAFWKQENLVSDGGIKAALARRNSNWNSSE